MPQRKSKPRTGLLSWARSTYRRLYPHRFLIVAAVIVVAYWATIVLWRAIETRPPHWDMGRHLLTAENYLIQLRELKLQSFLLSYNYYPPGLYWYTAGWMLVFGHGVLSSVASNLLWIALLVGSLLGIGYELKRPRVGIFAAVFCLTLPLYSSVARDFQIDVPLTAMVALNLYILFKTKLFQDRRWSVVYGLTVGAGMLVKWTFVAFAVWPLGIISFLAIQSGGWRAYVRNLGLAILVGYAIAMPWYIRNTAAIQNDFLVNGTAAGVREGDPLVFSLKGLTWYPFALISFYWHLPWLALQIASLVSLVRQKLYRNGLVLAILASSVGGILTFTLLRNKDARYILPALVGLSILVGLFLDQLYSRVRWAAVALIVVCLVSWLVTSFGPSMPSIGFGDNPRLVLWAPTGYITGAPTRQHWCLETAIDRAVARREPFYFEGLTSVWFNQWGIDYYTLLKEGVVGNDKNSRTKIGRTLDLPPDTSWSCRADDGSWVWTQRLFPLDN